jgi:hypothetical protein
VDEQRSSTRAISARSFASGASATATAFGTLILASCSECAERRASVL